MDNNQNGGVNRLMWPFRPVAQLIAIYVAQFGGYVTRGLYERFYRDSVANISAWLDQR